MGKQRNKIIAIVVILAALAGAWFYGGNYNPGDSEARPALAMPAAEAGATEATLPAAATAAEPGMEIDPKTGLDKYKTEPVPEGMPLPVEPQDTEIGDESFTVTISVRCDTILDNMNLLNKEKHELVPADGLIFPATEAVAYEGESVFNVFQREMKRARIHMSFRNTPIYNSAYILDVHNLYEFDTGELSGWMYKVNGWFPNYGCSRYSLHPGDVIEWVYTCDLGRDVGGGWLSGKQIDD